MISQSLKAGLGRLVFIALSALVVLPAMAILLRVEAQAPPANVNRLSVLFLGDEGSHRPFERAKTILPVLATNGIDMFYTDKPEDLNPAELAKYHSLIFYNNQPTLSRDQLAALTGFIEKGGGLVVLHCSSAAFQNSEEYIKLVGGAFKSHGLTSFTTTRVAANHPALQNVPSFTSEDETYVHTKHNPVDRTVLEVRRDGTHDEPYTWVKPYGKGRIYYTAWGHDQRTWSNEGFQKQVVQATRWASGDWALQRIAASEKLQTSRLTTPLPNYNKPPARGMGEPIWEAPVAQPVAKSIELTTLRPGFTMTAFATDPMIRRIIDFTWDARGRMWAVETNDYPNKVLPEGTPGTDRVLILEDTNRDGKADKSTVFVTGLNLATSIVLVKGGVIVAQAPDILFFRDTNGDDKSDSRQVLMTGFPRNDTHGTPSNFRYGLDNQVLASVGYNGFRGTVGQRTYGRGEFSQGYFRFPADGSNIDYLARTSNNTWGVAQSEDGYIFGSTANGRASQFVHIPTRYYQSLGIREPVLPAIENRADMYPIYPAIRQVDWFGLYTSGSGHEIYTARAFPEEYWNKAAFVADPTGHLVGQFEMSRNGSGYRAKNMWSFMASLDTWLSPVQIKVGPDGALWVSDFYTLVSQHNPTPTNLGGCCPNGPGNAYETPNRNANSGRIYRIAYRGAPAAAPMRLDNATPPQLVAALRNDNMFWRLMAQRLLVERGQKDVVPALVALLNDHTIDKQGLNPGALHALWTLDGLDAIESDANALRAARNAMHHPAGSIRRAALMVLPRNQQLENDMFAMGMLPDRRAAHETGAALAMNLQQDADPGVRLEALLVLSELPPSERTAAALMDVLFVAQNARDPWIPDAVAIAGHKQGPAFLTQVIERRVPTDRAAVTGVAKAIDLMTRAQAAQADPAVVVKLIEYVPRADAAVAKAILDGVAAGWPANRPPTLTPAQRTALATARTGAAAELAESFRAVATRWTLPDAFTAP
jgi:putative membrane-bound dehydrogenase-like protein